jgi:hypothetical protein
MKKTPGCRVQLNKLKIKMYKKRAAGILTKEL